MVIKNMILNFDNTGVSPKFVIFIVTFVGFIRFESA